MGEGVYEKSEGIDFKLIELEEYKTFYKKYFFKDFIKIIYQESPDIIVVSWPYILGFVFNIFLLKKIRNKNIKLIYKDIPFRLPKFWDGISFNVKAEPDENLKSVNYFLFNLGSFFVTLLRKYFLNLVDAHVNYVEAAYEILGSYGVPKEKIFITYNSPDTLKLLSVNKEIQNLQPILPDNPYRIIHVGRLVKWKKVDLLIKAFKKVKNKFNQAELIIIGSGPEKNNLENLVMELKLKENIVFVGGVYDNKTLGQYFQASSIYILAGMGGLSINEAMCFSKPIICSVCDGTEKHLVLDEYNGKYFEEDNESDLTNKIIYLLSDQHKLKIMGENSEKIIIDKININTVVNGYSNAFNYVCGI
jgi:glycosyltransferase involved in cell wall biosynthesis